MAGVIDTNSARAVRGRLSLDGAAGLGTPYATSRSSSKVLATRIICALLLCGVALTACDARSGDVVHANRGATQEAGSAIAACKECPEFVPVPSNADGMSISHVAKYELTWNQYLAAYDAGVCPLPELLDRKFKKFTVRSGDPVFQEFRRDYPISNLRPSDLKCYMQWLQRQTSARVRLPTYSEWEWFARSGHERRKFPWGDEPDPRREALARADIQDVLGQPRVNRVTETRVSHIILGTRVGLFPPTEWGLHDLMGNVPELTSDFIDESNIEAYRKKLGIEIKPQNSRRRIVKGELLADRSNSWREGIAKTRFVREADEGFSFPVGIRLVLEGQ